MHKEITNRVIEHMTSYYDGGIKELKAELEHYMHDRVKGEELSAYHAGVVMTEDGSFEIYYSQVLEALEEFYGDEFDESRYLTKGGELKYVKGEPFAWTIYKHMIGMASNKVMN